MIKLTNKKLTSHIITTPQINDTSADHQYVFAVSELASENQESTSLIATKGIIYTNNKGKIASLDDIFEYDTSSNTLNIMSSNVFDVSNSILKMSPSQKASIIEGIQQNIDIGKYSIKAKNIKLVDGAAKEETSGSRYAFSIYFHNGDIASGQVRVYGIANG
mgnify:CR=1 FL=1